MSPHHRGLPRPDQVKHFSTFSRGPEQPHSWLPRAAFDIHTPAMPHTGQNVLTSLPETHSWEEILISDCHWDVLNVCHAAKAAWYTLHLTTLFTFSTALITICNRIIYLPISLFTAITSKWLLEGRRHLSLMWAQEVLVRGVEELPWGPSLSILHLTQHCTLSLKNAFLWNKLKTSIS